MYESSSCAQHFFLPDSRSAFRANIDARMGEPAAATSPDIGHADIVSSSSSSDGEECGETGPETLDGDGESSLEDAAAARRRKLHDFLLEVQRMKVERLAKQHQGQEDAGAKDVTYTASSASSDAKPVRETELHRLKRLQAKLEKQLEGEDDRLRSIYELYEAASTKHRNGDFNGAAADWTRVLILDETDVDALFGRGQAKANMQNLPGAIEDYVEALAKDPTRAAIWFGLGAARSDLGDEDGAIADFGESLRLDPTRAEVWGCRATARLMQSDFANAASDCNEALDIDEGYAGAWGIRGTAKHRMGDHEGATHDLRKALELDPDLSWAEPILEEAIETCEHLMKLESIRSAAKACGNSAG